MKCKNQRWINEKRDNIIRSYTLSLRENSNILIGNHSCLVDCYINNYTICTFIAQNGVPVTLNKNNTDNVIVISVILNEYNVYKIVIILGIIVLIHLCLFSIYLIIRICLYGKKKYYKYKKLLLTSTENNTINEIIQNTQ